MQLGLCWSGHESRWQWGMHNQSQPNARVERILRKHSQCLGAACEQAKRKRADMGGLKLVVAGCVGAQEGSALLRRVPELDLVMGPHHANRRGTASLQPCPFPRFLVPKQSISDPDSRTTGVYCLPPLMAPAGAAFIPKRQGRCLMGLLVWLFRLDQLLEQVDQGSQVVAVDPIQITEDIAVPRRDSDLTAWVRLSTCPSLRDCLSNSLFSGLSRDPEELNRSRAALKRK